MSGDPAAVKSGGLFSGRRVIKKKSVEDGPAEFNRNVAISKMAKDMSELDIAPTVELIADKADSYLKFSYIIRPIDGLWAGGKFEFKFEIPENYPWGAPKVTCVDAIWHPNIDMDGKPCVNVLQKNWKPTYTIETVMFGLMFLFSDPNPLDPLNIEAADEMRSNLTLFKQNVLKALRGGKINGINFSRNEGGSPELFGTKH